MNGHAELAEASLPPKQSHRLGLVLRERCFGKLSMTFFFEAFCPTILFAQFPPLPWKK
jgi:hypothetical protein